MRKGKFCIKKRFFTFIEIFFFTLIFACGGGGGGGISVVETGGPDEIVFTGAVGAEKYIELGIKKSLLGTDNSNVYYVIFDVLISSWDEKYEDSGRVGTDLQDMINAAGNDATVSEIRKYVFIQEGTYIPGETRENSFSMKNNVTIIGGFLGTEENGVPKGKNGNTILYGNNNSYHVFFHAGATSVDATAQLRNVTITGGNANLGGINTYGGGMYNDNSSPTIAGCSFVKNTASSFYAVVAGGGMYNIGDSSPTLVSCSFRENTVFSESTTYTAVVYGGGLYHKGKNLTLKGCVFANNEAVNNTSSIDVTSAGGGIFTENSDDITFTDCIFENNKAYSDCVSKYVSTSGGGICNRYSKLELINCSFINNIAYSYSTLLDTEIHISASGGGMFSNASVTLRDCTFRGNTSYAYLRTDSLTKSTAFSTGGGMSTSSANITLSGCTFKGNKATAFAPTRYIDCYGGGVFYSSTVEIYWNAPNNIFSSNTTDHGSSASKTDNINNNSNIVSSPPANVIYQ